MPLKGEPGRFRGVVEAFPETWRGKVLDVGCRGGGLKEELKGRPVEYCGLDLAPPADVVADLNKGLPFEPGTFDLVAALDVLEHTDDIHGSFREVCRVSRAHVVLALPNAFAVEHRLKFALGRQISGKYGLPVEPPADRHRWLFSLDEARSFCASWAGRCGYSIATEGCLAGRRRVSVMSRAALLAFPNLLCPTYLVLLRRNGS